MHRRKLVALPLGALLALLLLPAPGISAAPKKAVRAHSDTRELPPGYKSPRLVSRGAAAEAARRQATAAPRTAAIGDTKYWLALDDLNGILYLKQYTLRGEGTHSEVWVASDSDTVSSGTDFPAGDCRNGVRTQITDAQVNYLIGQFDTNIYKRESYLFSKPPDRDGNNAPLTGLAGLPTDYYVHPGNAIVVLVDNVRDDNFYDTNNQNGFSYIAGFFAGFMNEYLNSNVMTIDAFDWLHRTGPNPPNEPVPGDLCKSAPARPFLYEGVFAHEYQHLLEYYRDPDEVTWVNEGLSDYAQTLTGYVDASLPITDVGFDSHVQCFLGWLGVQTAANPNPRQGGPENSLNLWGDQTDYESEILCDYGAAYSFMLMLADRYTPQFLGQLHRDTRNGFEGLQALLDNADPGRTVAGLINEWAAIAALDGVLDDGATLHGNVDPASLRVSTLDAMINWATDQTYSSPGAPPNGSDFVRARDGGGYLNARQIHKITFNGANQLPSLPVEWTVDANPPRNPGNSALFSGTGDNLDRAIVRQVAVPSGSPQLTFKLDWSLEEGYDYAYVQISTDGGVTYQTIPCSDQVAGVLGSAWNGFSNAFMPESCDLSAFAGQTVVVSFRVVTDPGVHYEGVWLDDVAMDGTTLSDGTTLAGWQSLTQYHPIDVEGFTVRLISYDKDHTLAHIAKLPLHAGFRGILRGMALPRRIGRRAKFVAIVVTYHDSTELVGQYAPYILRVNGVLQPGGS